MLHYIISQRIRRVLLGFFVLLSLSWCNVGIGDTNDLPVWFTYRGVVWGGETNGVRAGITDTFPVKGVEIFVTWSTNNLNVVYFAPPDKKFSKMELRDTNGTAVTPIKGKELAGDLAARISVANLPHTPSRGTFQRGSGPILVGRLAENPSTLCSFQIPEVYQILKEGDYVLKVWPSIYQCQLDEQFVSRLDLPCVEITAHLKPPKEGVGP